MPDLLTGHNPPTDADPSPRADQSTAASWYTQGRMDGIGDRLLMFDNSGAPALEILRFRREFIETPGFETALRARVEQLRGFRHPAFPKVRTVDFGQEGTALVSTHVPGWRLSEVLDKARGPSFAREVIRQLTPALAALHQYDGGLTHGALALDRIVVTPEGRLLIIEHALGLALEQLDLPPRRLWGELGVIAHPAADSKWDCRADVFQLGLVALSVVIGRRVRPDEYPDIVPELVERLDLRNRPSPLTPFLPWLERALQLEGRLFESARDALEELGEINDPGISSPDEGRRLLSATEAAGDTSGRAGTFDSVLRQWGTPAPAPTPVASRSEPVVAVRPGADYVLPAAPSEAPARVLTRPVQAPARSRRVRSLTAALAVLAAGEGVLIGALLGNRIYADPVGTPVLVEFSEPGADVWVNGRRVGTTPVELKLGSNTRTIRIMPQRVDVADRDEDTKPADSVAPTEAMSPTTQLPTNPAQSSSERPYPERPDNTNVVRSTGRSARSGGLQLSSPIELMILEDGRLLGSSEGDPITLPEGRHEIELVNSTVGYRSLHSVVIRRGEVASLPVVTPKGIVHINALPWAEVWVDGALIGETPLANLSLAVGEHEFVFRHPTLGERRSTAIVRADEVTRVSANLRQ